MHANYQTKTRKIQSYSSLEIARIICKNCGEKLDKKFCGHCGQSSIVHRIELRSLIHDIPHAVFHVDSGFFYNVSQLFTRPGHAIKDYLDGRRKPFFHPVTYLAILLVFNLFAVKLTDLHYYDQKELLLMSPEQIQFIKEYDATQWWFLEHTYLYMLIAIPCCTIFFHFFLHAFRKKFNFAENGVIVMFIIAQGVLIQSTIYLLVGWVRNGVFIRTVEIVNLTCLLLYAAYAMYQLIKPARNKWRVGIAVGFGGLAMLLIMLGSAYVLLELSKLLSANH